MKSVLCALAATCVAGSLSAQTLETRQLADGVFASIDRDADGLITVAEAHTFNGDVLVSMDDNDDGAATLEEFLSWNVGFAAAADMRMRGEALALANRLMFELMDMDGNARLTKSELDEFQTSAFAQADTDGDDALSSDEFYDRHVLNVATRIALSNS